MDDRGCSWSQRRYLVCVGRGDAEEIIVPGSGGLLLELVSPGGDLGAVLLQRRDRLEEGALLLLQSEAKV